MDRHDLLGSMKMIQSKDGGIPLDFKMSHAELTAVGHGRAKRGLQSGRRGSRGVHTAARSAAPARSAQPTAPPQFYSAQERAGPK